VTNHVAGEGAADRWARQLDEWSIPEEILASAPQTPFVFTPEMFAAAPAGSFTRSRSSEIAMTAIPDNGTVLDVGCGGGAAAFALLPRATHVIGTDRQQNMLDLFLATAEDRGVGASGVCGSWPDIADAVGVADVVVCHNVLYNAPDIVAFADALDRRSSNRVVLEITEFHPQTVRAPLWRQFWNIDRPSVPTAWTAAEALSDAGFPVNVERSTSTRRDADQAESVEAAFWTRRLCLPADREPEVAAAIEHMTFPSERLAIWWDTRSV